MVKDILTYPLLTTTVACFILFGLMYWVMPQFAAIFEELLEGAPLPWLTQVILSISRFTREHWPVIAVLFAALIGFTAWLLSDGLVARRLFIEVVKSFPFSGVVFYNLAMARICSLWAIMIRRQVSHQEALLAIAPLVEHRSLGDALERLAAKCAEGHSLVEEMARETDLSEMLLLTFRHSPEKDLANRLAMLGELFRQRASMGFRRVGIVWEFTAMMAMAGIVGLFIFIAFMPFLNMLF
jgi:type IV pilus assembly protein PilC